MSQFKYLSGYPEATQNQVKTLIDEGRLATIPIPLQVAGIST